MLRYSYFELYVARDRAAQFTNSLGDTSMVDWQRASDYFLRTPALVTSAGKHYTLRYSMDIRSLCYQN